MQLFVEHCKCKDRESTYHALKCDFGYRTAVISMEKDICAELLGISLGELYNMQVGEKRQVNVKGGK